MKYRCGALINGYGGSASRYQKVMSLDSRDDAVITSLGKLFTCPPSNQYNLLTLCRWKCNPRTEGL